MIFNIGKQRTKELNAPLLKIFCLVNRIVEMKSNWINDFTLFSGVPSSFCKDGITKELKSPDIYEGTDCKTLEFTK